MIDAHLRIETPIEVKRSVKIIGSEIGAITSVHSDPTDHSLFDCTGEFVEFDSLAFYNSSKSGLSSAIEFNTGSSHGLVRSCLIEDFSWGGIWQFDCHNLVVDSCDIIGNAGTSYNYGIWQGGKSNVSEQKLFFTNSRVEAVRHAIGSSYHPNSYYAIGNTISTLKHSFDRHNWNSGGRKGGLHTVISGNTFLDPDRLAFSVEPPYEGGSFIFTGNTLNHASTRHIGEIAKQQVWEQNNGNISIHSNKFTD